MTLLRVMAVALPAIVGATLTAAAADNTPTLRGLVFVPDDGSFKRNGIALPAGAAVDLTRVTILDRDAFRADMRALIGKPLAIATLSEIVPLATKVFEAAGRPLVNITIPEQDIGSGIVQVVVGEYRVGKVTIEGANHFSPELYKRAIGAVPNETIDMPTMSVGLRQLNTSDYRSVEVGLQPGGQSGTVDVTLRATERRPVTVSLGYDNAGSTGTGRNQWTAGVGVANTVGTLDDTLSYQFLSSDFVNRRPSLLSHSLSYALTVPRVGIFSLSGNYSTTRPLVDSFLTSLGQSTQVGARFTREVFGTEDTSFLVRAGFDYKSTNNDLAFGGQTIANSVGRIGQFELAAILGAGDRWGRTDGSVSGIVSPGRLFGGNDDASFSRLSPTARARYAYVRAEATRSTNLPASFVWWTKATAQFAGQGLLASEQLNGGGVASARGYPTSTVRGDGGLMVSNELRFPGFGLTGLAGRDLMDRFQPYLFLDYAAVSAHRAAGTRSEDGTLTSFGPGVRIIVDRYVSLGLDTGVQLRTAGGQRYPGQFLDVSLTVRY